jgi:uncharacterized protein (TIGR02996 family)
MTTEDDFQNALAAQPQDWQTRLVFADWLQEHNDPRAEGYRAMGMRRVTPRHFKSASAWVWLNAHYAASYGKSSEVRASTHPTTGTTGCRGPGHGLRRGAAQALRGTERRGPCVREVIPERRAELLVPVSDPPRKKRSPKKPAPKTQSRKKPASKKQNRKK